MKTIKDIKEQKEHFMAFSIRLNDEERNVLRRLKNEYSINISGITKNFLKERLQQLDDLRDKNK